MGVIYLSQPQYLVDHPNNPSLRKPMFIRKGGKAMSKTGFDLSRDVFDVELICISDEDESNWIGNYAEGFGFFGVRFAKEDCRDASDDEVNAWIADHASVTF